MDERILNLNEVSEIRVLLKCHNISEEKVAHLKYKKKEGEKSKKWFSFKNMNAI